jgi:hypothetical protein
MIIFGLFIIVDDVALTYGICLIRRIYHLSFRNVAVVVICGLQTQLHMQCDI